MRKRSNRLDDVSCCHCERKRSNLDVDTGLLRRSAPRNDRAGVFLCLIAALFFLTACNDPSKPAYEYMPDMMDQQSVKAQEAPMRTPPVGAIPRGFAPYPYTAEEGESAGRELKNPFPFTKENILRGQTAYNIYCIVCHGPKGDGNGSIVPKFPRPPSVTSEKVADWPDGRIFHVMTKGQNLMASYATQIPPEDRWAVVHYIRALRRAAHPTGEDVEALKKALKEGTYP